MGSESVRVVVVDIEKGRTEDVVYELGRALDLPRADSKALLAELPATVAEDVSREEAERIEEKLAAAGAEVAIEDELEEEEEDVCADDEPEEAEEELEEEEEPEEEDSGDGEPFDDEEWEEEEDEEEEEEELRRRERSRRRRLPERRTESPASQRVLLYGGLGSLAVIAVTVIILATAGGRGCSGCASGSYRGAGAPEQLAGLLPRVAERFASGFSPDDVVAHGSLASGESARLSEDVAGGRCYIWIGLSPDGTDLDLMLRDGASTVSEDQATDNFPVVQHCVAEDTTLSLEVKMYQGQAEWVVQRYALQGSPGADQVQLLHDLYSKRLVANAEPVGPHKRFRLGPGEEVTVDLPMDPAWCYVPLGVSPPGTDLDIFLHDPQGRVVEQDQARDNFPAVRHCPMEAGTYKVRLLMFGGEGDAVFRVYRGKLGDGPQSRQKLGG